MGLRMLFPQLSPGQAWLRPATSGMLALTGVLGAAVEWLVREGKLPASVMRDQVAAISVGVWNGTPVLDLDYAEDVACDTDMNVVMLGQGGLIEIQGTAEGAPFSRAELDALLDLADRGIRELMAAQKAAIAA